MTKSICFPFSVIVINKLIHGQKLFCDIDHVQMSIMLVCSKAEFQEMDRLMMLNKRQTREYLVLFQEEVEGLVAEEYFQD